MRTAGQPDLFADDVANLPAGFRYKASVVPQNLQADLIREIADLPLEPFDFQGFKGRRRVISYGWTYDADTQRLKPGAEMPSFLAPAKAIAASFAGIAIDSLQQALVTEYAPGAPIGWHRDKRAFGRVIGLSLLSACSFRLRRQTGSKWERVQVVAEPGSAYLLSGPARTEWEHSIPPVDDLRYSITFRQLA